MKFTTAAVVSSFLALASALPQAFPPTPPNTIYVRLDDNGFTPSTVAAKTGNIVIIAIEGPDAHGVSQSGSTVCTFRQGGLQFPVTKNPTGAVLQTTYPYSVPANFNGITFFDPSSTRGSTCKNLTITALPGHV